MADNLITLTHEQYYDGKDNAQLTGDDKQYGNYQFMKIGDVIDDVVATYCGPGMLLEGIRQRHVKYHAHRAMQELSFDTFRSTRSMEIEIPPSLLMALPHDYVGYTKVTWKDSTGIEHTLYPAILTSNPKAYLQDSAYELTFDSGEALTAGESDTWAAYKTAATTTTTSNEDDRDVLEFSHGMIYGAEPKHMNANGSFYIDYARGRIHFSGNCSGKTITLKYISDGVGVLQAGTDTGAPWVTERNIEQDFIVHKFAQEAMIKHILYGCAQSKSKIDHNMLALLKKEKWAETRKAKIRLSEIKIEEITQIMRGKSKWIKH
jgi:hypothetical protein